MKIHPFRILCILALCLMLAFNMTGCGSSSGADSVTGSDTDTSTDSSTDDQQTAPTPTPIIYKAGNIEVSTSRNKLTADGASSCTVQAMVTDSYDQPIVADSVVFSVISGEGRFTEAVSGATSITESTEGGLATTTFYASETAGTVTIKAMARSTGVTDEVTITLAKGTMQLNAFPDELVADGNSRSTITATLLDPDGRLVSNPVSVDFNLTGVGGLPYTSSSRWNSTDSSGQVSIEYLAGETAGVVTISASAIGYETTTVSIRLITSRITLVAVPDSIVADGVKESTISAWVTDINGDAVQDETVDFSVSGGGGLPVAPSFRTSTNSEGIADATYRSPTYGGAAVVTATTTSGATASVSILLIQEEIGSLSLASGLAGIPADGQTSTTITASVRTISGSAPPPGTPITFQTTLGTFPQGGTVRMPDETGEVTISLLSATVPGTAEVSALVGNVSQKITVEFTGAGSQAPPAIIQMTATPPSIGTGGESSSIQATILNSSGDPVAIGTEATFSTTLGTLSLNSTQTGNDRGEINLQLSSGNQGGLATVTCTSSGVSSSLRVEIQSDAQTAEGYPPAYITMTADRYTIQADVESAIITALIKDSTGTAISPGTEVTFSLDVDSESTFYGTSSYTTQTLDDQGIVTVALKAGSVQAVETVTCTSGTVSQSIKIEVEGSSPVSPNDISIGLSRTTISTDNSNTSVITATVLDQNRVPIANAPVEFRTENPAGEPAGEISASVIYTDEQGKAQVTFSSGDSDRRNQVVTIYASVGDLETSVPIVVTGTTVTLNTDKTRLSVDPVDPDDDSDTATVGVLVQDAGPNPIHLAPVSIYAWDLEQDNVLSNVIRLEGPDTCTSVSDNQLECTTSLGLISDIKVIGATDGEVRLHVESMGASEELEFFVGGNVFQILSTSPGENDEGYVVASTNNPIEVTVKNPDERAVMFSTSCGNWRVDGNPQFFTVPVDDATGEVSLSFSSEQACAATVQVYELDEKNNFLNTDSIEIVITAASDEATQIALQSSANVLPRSIGDSRHQATLEATVTNAQDQVVGGAMVAFSIVNPTGGGETVSPVIVQTDGAGVATSYFTSGSLATDNQGVIVRAEIVGGPNAFSTIPIIIGGEPASVVVTHSTLVYKENDGTTYRLPMAVIVSDTNGNPVEGANVSLSLWPSQYWKGTRPMCDQTYILYTSDSPLPNEDVNRNNVMEPGEDTNGDNQLTPLNSAAGTIDPTVVTDENGVGTFDLHYLVIYGLWLDVEITASTMVYGTETQGVQEFRLPVLAEDIDGCLLPTYSPFNEFGGSGTFSMSVSTSPEDGQIASDGTATIIAEVLDPNGDPYTTPVPVTFTSECATNGTSNLDGEVYTVNGVAEATYQAQGCQGNDWITVTATIDDQTITEYVQNLVIAQPDVGSIRFVSANPTQIALRGTGGVDRQETSELTFRVFDENGNPAPGIFVTFSLESYVGGAEVNYDWCPATDPAFSDCGDTRADILNYTTVSNQNGEVTTVVTAGTAATAIRVTATVVWSDDQGGGTVTVAGSNPPASVQTISDSLTVSIGVADQDSFSISLDIMNPEGLNYDGEEVKVTVRPSDINNNPVPDNTSIYFRTEGGTIQDSCTTTGGACQVTWTSQNPRPADGLVTILATAIGEETFIDSNGNGVFDNLPGSTDSLAFTDLAEPFLDVQWVGESRADDAWAPFYDVGEVIADYNFNNTWDNANGLYNGTLCDSGPCTDELVYVRAYALLQMSGSSAVITFWDPDVTPMVQMPHVELRSALNPSEVKTVMIRVEDINGNSMPYGTTIDADTSSAIFMTTITLWNVESRMGPTTKYVTLRASADGYTTGPMEVVVTTPNGVETSASIMIMDDG